MGMHDPNGQISAPSTYSSYLEIILSQFLIWKMFIQIQGK